MTDPASRRPNEPETKKALYEAFDQVLRDGRTGPAAPRTAPRPSAGRRRLTLVLGLLVLIGASLLVVRPGWLFPPPPPAEPAPVQEASLRIAMFMQAQRVEMFRAVNGRLPTSMEEAGGAVRGIRFRPGPGDGFALEGTNGPVTLSYESTQPLSAFLGDSYGVLIQRGTL